jgi:hypothetical protein
MTGEIVKQRIRIGDSLLGPTNVTHRVWKVQEIHNQERIVLLTRRDGRTQTFNMEYIEEFFLPWVDDEVVLWRNHNDDAPSNIAYDSISVGTTVVLVLEGLENRAFVVSKLNENTVELIASRAGRNHIVSYIDLESFFAPVCTRSNSLASWKEYAAGLAAKRVTASGDYSATLHDTKPTNGNRVSLTTQLQEEVSQLREMVEKLNNRLVSTEREVQAIKNERYF